MCPVWSGTVGKQTRTAARLERKQMHERQKSAVEVLQRFLQTNLISFVFLESLLMKASPGMVSLEFTQKWLREGQGLWEVCRRKDNKGLTVVLYFFLLQDAPRSPSVLIGSGERSRARCADVNGAWRTSAAGTNIPTSLLPFLHPLARSLTRSISSASTSVQNI